MHVTYWLIQNNLHIQTKQKYQEEKQNESQSICTFKINVKHAQYSLRI